MQRHYQNIAAGLLLGLSAISCSQSQNYQSESAKTEISQNISADTQIEIFQPAAIKAVANGVVDWQLDHMELSEFKAFIPSFQDRSEEKRGWIQGTFLKGMADWAIATENTQHLEYLKDFAEKQNYELEARIYHADDHVVGQYYSVLYGKYNDPKMIEPTLRVFNQILDNPSDVTLDFSSKSTEPGYSHVCKKRWCWSDALFMGPPVWTNMSKITGDAKYLEFSDKEFWVTTDYLFDSSESLFLRDSRFFDRREKNGEKIFWSRGNGWVFAGLTDIIDDLPKDHPSYGRYVELYKTMAARLIELQFENGYWPVSLTAGELYPVPESSGTAFFVAGLSWGVANGILDTPTYMPSIKTGWSALNGAIRENGMLGWVQQVGYAPDKVSQDETQFYGNGAFLLASAGVYDLSQKGLFDE